MRRMILRPRLAGLLSSLAGKRSLSTIKSPTPISTYGLLHDRFKSRIVKQESKLGSLVCTTRMYSSSSGDSTADPVKKYVNMTFTIDMGESQMCLALKNRDFDQVEDLMKAGWNAYIAKSFESDGNSQLLDLLDKIFLEDPVVYTAILLIFSKYPTSGISPETELKRLLSQLSFHTVDKFNEDQVWTLVKLGITYDSYYRHTRSNVFDDTRCLRSYINERGERDLSKFKFDLEAHFFETNKKIYSPRP